MQVLAIIIDLAQIGRCMSDDLWKTPAIISVPCLAVRFYFALDPVDRYSDDF